MCPLWCDCERSEKTGSKVTLYFLILQWQSEVGSICGQKNTST
jgi:hypothetical protein